MPLLMPSPTVPVKISFSLTPRLSVTASTTRVALPERAAEASVSCTVPDVPSRAMTALPP